MSEKPNHRTVVCKTHHNYHPEEEDDDDDDDNDDDDVDAAMYGWKGFSGQLRD
ncbi:MAG: hypothetical protein Q9217_003639 [Psora testacea]